MTQRVERLLERLAELEARSFLVTNPTDVRWLTGFDSSNAALVVVRDGSEKTLTVKLDERSEKVARRDAEATADKAALGVSVAPLTPQLAERAGLPKDAQGLVVQDVDPDGRAADAGIQGGDIIREVNRQPIHSVEDLRAAVKRNADRPALILNVDDRPANLYARDRVLRLHGFTVANAETGKSALNVARQLPNALNRYAAPQQERRDCSFGSLRI